MLHFLKSKKSSILSHNIKKNILLMTYTWYTLNLKMLKDCINVNILKIVLELMKQILLFDHLLTWENYLSIYNSDILKNTGR